MMKPQGKLSIFCSLTYQPLIVFISFIVLVFYFATPGVQASTGIYHAINFQGKIVNKADGTNISDGTYSFTFKFYDAASSGNQLPVGSPWSETQSLPVTSGVFKATLGSVTAIPSTLDFNSDSLYLDITFNGETFTTRVQMTAVPYAFNAERVNGLSVTNTTGTLTVPNGTTITFSGANNLTLTTTGATTATLPAGTITLADISSIQTLTNKTIGSTGLTFSGATTGITTVSNQNFTIVPNGTGKVGIGTTSPGAFLDVNGNVNIATYATAGASLAVGYASVPGGVGNAVFSGNVGIGTTSPTALLQLSSSAVGSTLLDVLFNGSSEFNVSDTQINNNVPASFAAAGDIGIAYDLNFTNPTASYIKSEAPLYLVSGEPYASSDLTLQTYNYGNVNVDSHMFVQNSTITGQAVGIFNQTESQDILTASASGTPKFVIANNGNVTVYGSATTCVIGNGTGATNCTSDQRLKTDIQPFSSSLAKVMQLQPITYKWKDPNKEQNTHVGFIAQDVQKVLPEFVANVYGDYLGVDYAGLVVPVVGAIQEQEATMSALLQSLHITSTGMNIDAQHISGNQISAGLVVADSLNAKQILGLDDKLATLSAGIAQLQSSFSSSSAEGDILNKLNALDSRVGFLEQTNVPHATDSGVLNLTQQIIASSSGLTFTGKTNVFDLNVLGKLTSGLLTIDTTASDSASIQTLMTPLRLQKDSLGDLQIMGTKIVVDTQGNMVSQSSITAQQMKTHKLTILVDRIASDSAILSASAGKAQIPAGQTSLQIKTTMLTPDSLIFATPENTPTPIATHMLDDQTFQISINTAQSQQLIVDWWIVN